MRRCLVVFCGFVLVYPLIHNTAAQVRINEFLANNVSVNPDNVDFDDFSDWVELYNAGSSEADIGGYYITGDLNQPKKWQIPTGTTIPPNGFLLIWCDDADAEPGETIPPRYYDFGRPRVTMYHANFKLAKAGEQVGLFNASGAIVDSITFPKQYKDVSMGRASDGNWAYFDEPTPKKANTTPVKQATQAAGDVTFSVQGGYYSSAQSVTLSASDGDIYYTTDCSIPLASKATKYSGPISIGQTTVLRARCIPADKFAGRVATNTYFINEKACKVMVVAIASDPAFLFDDTIGIYKNSRKGFEVPISIEFFTTDGKQAVKANAGVRIGSLTGYSMPQKPLQIALRDRYGDPFVNYQFYAKPITKFDRFRLRNGGDAYNSSIINDALLDPICNGQAAVGYQAYRATVVYLNGEYYGIYDLREQFKDMYFAENYGITNPEQRDECRSQLAPSVSTLPANETWELVNGTWDSRGSLMNLVKSGTMDASKYNQVKGIVDIASFSDFFILIDFAKAISWGHNQDMWCMPGGKMRWLVTDFDRGFVYDDGFTKINHNGFTTSSGSSPKMITDTLLNPLLTNTEFVNYFVQRYAAHLNSTLKTSRLVFIVDSIANQYQPEMADHVAKWKTNGVRSVSAWQDEINSMKKFMQDRPQYVWEHLTEAPFSISGGKANLTVNLVPAEAEADIFINGVRMSQGLTNINMFKGIAFTVKAVGKPGWQCAGWDGGNGNTDSMSVTLSGDQTITARFGTASVDERNPVVPSEWSGIIDRAVSSHGSIVLTLDCSFSTNERLDVALFDISGRQVERLLNAETAAGEHRIQLSTKQVARGVYYYRIHTDNAVITRMITVQ